MKDSPNELEAQNKQYIYETPVVIHEGVISTRAQTGQGTPVPQDGQTSIPVDDLLSM